MNSKSLFVKLLNLILIFCIPIIIHSCSGGSVYQLYRLQGVGDEIHSDNDFKVLCFENDTLRICYSFWSENGKIYFEVFNKMDVDIYIDLSRSGLIYDSTRIPYWENVSTTTENAIHQSTHRSYFSPNTNIIIGSSTTLVKSKKTNYVPEKVIFLPPKIAYGYSKSVLLSIPKFLVDFDSLSPIYTGSQISGYKQFFSRENSPLLFKSTLAYSLSEDLKPLLKVNNGFFVEEIETASKNFYDGYLLSATWPGNHKRYYQHFNYISWNIFRDQVKSYSKSQVNFINYSNINQVAVSDSVLFHSNNTRYFGVVLGVLNNLEVKVKIYTPNNNYITDEIEYYKLKKYLKI